MLRTPAPEIAMKLILAGLTVWHIGDADITDENFERIDLEKSGTDAAFVPYSNVTSQEGHEPFDRQFAPKKIITVRFDPWEADKITKQPEAADLSIQVFTRSLETVAF